MAEKKKNIKTEKKIKIAPSQPEPTILVKEDAYPAIEIAEMLNVSSFDFFRLKQDAGINENSFLTVSEFTDIYNKIIKR